MATEVGALPDDALANVFRALSLRGLAVVRCVCKAWHDVVDARALLLPHLHHLPRTVRGVFINYLEYDHPHHFVRPCSSSTIPRVDGTLSFLPNDWRRWVSVLDHCNGLLLCGKSETEVSELCVCNPATCRWTVLPHWWEDADDKRRHHYAGGYIAFDPAESPQYEVILVPTVPKKPSPEDRWMVAELLWEKEKDAPFCLDWFFSLPEDGTAVGQWEFQQLPSDDLLQYDINDPCRYKEWPPAPWTLRVFSSSSSQWEDKAFVREGMPAGTIEKMRSDFELHYRPPWRYAVYHHGSLYVHCRGSFIASGRRYDGPWTIEENIEIQDTDLSEEEENNEIQNIDHDVESLSKEEDIEIHDTDHDVESLSAEENIEIQDTDHDADSLSEEEKIEIQDTDHDVDSLSEEKNIETQDTDHDVESLSEEGHEWDSDNDDTFTINTGEYFDDYKQLNIIGFHPYKEVVFMVRRFHVVAYHLNSTKIQYLGNSYPKYCYHNFWDSIYQSFLYTPCMIGDLLHGDQNGGQSSSED